MKSRLAAALLLAAAAALFVLAFSRLPIEDSGLAIDWKVFWRTTNGFRLDYTDQLAFSPPWALALLWPLTALPLSAGWALWAFLLVGALVFAVQRGPSKAMRWPVILLLCSSYPAVRQFVDGNLELLVIIGALLLLAALPRRRPWLFAAGALLASAKIQVSWLLLLVAVLWAWRLWGRRAAIRAYALIAAPALLVLLWRGAEWLQAMQRFPFAGTAIDASLRATLARLQAPGLFWLLGPLVLLATLAILRRRPRLELLDAGVLAAAGLLLAPYAASNSVLTPLALAGPALSQRRPWLGVAVFALADLPYFFLRDVAWRTNLESNYWTVFLLLLWAFSLWELHVSTKPRINP